MTTVLLPTVRHQENSVGFLICDYAVLNLVILSCDHYKNFNTGQITHNNLVESNMQPLSTAQRNHFLSLLDSGHSAHQISSSTGLHISTISRLRRKHHPYLQKPILPSFLRQILAMPSTSSPPGRLKMPPRSPRPSGTSLISLSQPKLLVITWIRLG